jgi:hypothetical protein
MLCFAVHTDVLSDEDLIPIPDAFHGNDQHDGIGLMLVMDRIL